MLWIDQKANPMMTRGSKVQLTKVHHLNEHASMNAHHLIEVHPCASPTKYDSFFPHFLYIQPNFLP